MSKSTGLLVRIKLTKYSSPIKNQPYQFRKIRISTLSVSLSGSTPQMEDINLKYIFV